jgi:hypothetical protein
MQHTIFETSKYATHYIKGLKISNKLFLRPKNIQQTIFKA